MLNLSELTIGTKIKSGFGVLVILAIMIGAVGFWKATAVDNNVTDLDKIFLPISSLTGAASEGVLHQELAMHLYILHKEERHVEAFKKYDAAVSHNFEMIKELIAQNEYLSGQNWLGKIEHIDIAHNLFVTESRKLVEVIAANDQVAINTQTETIVDPSFKTAV